MEERIEELAKHHARLCMTKLRGAFWKLSKEDLEWIEEVIRMEMMNMGDDLYRYWKWDYELP